METKGPHPADTVGMSYKKLRFWREMSVIGPVTKDWLVYLNTQECTAKTANTGPQGCSSHVIYAQANLLHQD